MDWVVGLDVHKDTIAATALNPVGVVAAEAAPARRSAAAAHPVTHWDSTVDETMTPTSTIKTWVLHIGDSFTDVPDTSPTSAPAVTPITQARSKRPMNLAVRRLT